MLSSMTAFARQEIVDNNGTLTWELRSLNHRYLELNVRLPEMFSVLEPAIREQVKLHLQRGKVDVTLRFAAVSGKAAEFSLNKNLIAQLIRAHDEIAAVSGIKDKALDPIELMRWPGVMQGQEVDATATQHVIMDLLKKTLQELSIVRQREGKAIQQFIQDRLHDLQKQVAAVKIQLPKILAEQKRLLQERLTEIAAKLDAARVEQELVLFAMKLDVAEELNRLETHIIEMRKTLDQKGSIGRRLDFLLQELGREANTLGSKSAAVETTLAAVAMKVIIEQMREQVQNVE